MNYRMLLRLVSLVMRIVAAFMLPPLVICLFWGETAAAQAFIVTIGLMMLLSAITFLFPPKKKTLYAREGFVVVSITWVAVSLLGALPFYLSDAIPSYVDCIFETVSGFTTTGASILSDVESMPMGLLYWRSFTHWLGGMGVLVFLLAIAPLDDSSGDTMHIMRAESPGPQVGKLVPRTRQSARILYEIYIAMTVLQCVLLLAGGMPLFDSVATAFGTAGTGGFGIKNDSFASYSPYLQWVVTIFMTLFGVNFGVYYLLLMRSFRRAAKNEEIRLYFGVILVAIAICTLSVLPQFKGEWEPAIRHSAFQVASIITTTGFSTTNFDLWPQLCRMLLVLLMIVGACAGSTGGGVKCSRVLILWRAVREEIKRMLHPNTVSTLRMDGESVPRTTVVNTFAFLGAYSFIAFGSMLLIALDEFSFDTNLSGVMACLNNIGPGLGIVGPAGNYGAFSDFSKIVLSVDMLIGRLEIFPILMLFTPKIWKRARG